MRNKQNCCELSRPIHEHVSHHTNVFWYRWALVRNHRGQVSVWRLVNSVSISGMLTGQWKAKPRWPPTEANFGRQFQSPTQACTSVLVSHATFYIFWRVFLGNTHETCLQNIEISLRILNIFRQSQTELKVIYFHENKLPNIQETW